MMQRWHVETVRVCVPILRGPTDLNKKSYFLHRPCAGFGTVWFDWKCLCLMSHSLLDYGAFEIVTALGGRVMKGFMKQLKEHVYLLRTHYG